MTVDDPAQAAAVSEYGSVVKACRRPPGDEHAEVDYAKLKRLLCEDCGWTPHGAAELERLARAYGSFMLKNALVLSLALGIEDGALGF